MRRRPIVNPQAAVAQSVADLLNKFEYPDLDTQPLPALIGGGGGAPTVVVAASNATDLSKSKADFVCGGVNDQDTLQAADALMASVGGRLLLTEGLFACSDDVTLSADVQLQGVGRGTTLSFDSSGIGLSVATYCIVNNLEIDSRGHGIQVDGGSVFVQGVTFVNALTSEACILIPGTRSFLHVLGCYSQASGPFIRATGSSTHLQESIIAENIVEYSGSTGPSADPIIELDNSYHIKLNIIANMFDNGTGIRIGNNSTLSPVATHIIGNNNFHSDANGIYLARSDDSIIAGNRINPDQHGIQLDDTDECQIYGNQILEPGRGTDNTYDGIHVENDSNGNYFHGNRIEGRASSPQPRYAVNIADSNCDCNIVVGNDFGPTADYGTDQLNDNGSSTQLFYPADATYGDNFIGCWGS